MSWVYSKPAETVAHLPKCECTEFVIVALGSNLGDPGQNVLRAMDRLQLFSRTPLLRSSLWQTAPVDCPPGSPPFVNAVAAFLPMPGETPESLLEKLQALEKDFGRTPKKLLNQARPLDLDIIVFGEKTRSTPQLTIPHPRAHLREFVLGPLNEIAPDLVLPGQDFPVSKLLSRLRSQAKAG